MHDVLESIVGDMHAAGVTDLDAVERGNGSWLLDGSLLIDEFKEIFPVATRADEDRSYETIAGLVITQLGRLPRTADSFEWQGLRFEVVDMDGRRVDKVLVPPVPTEVAPSPNKFSDG